MCVSNFFYFGGVGEVESKQIFIGFMQAIGTMANTEDLSMLYYPLLMDEPCLDFVGEIIM